MVRQTLSVRGIPLQSGPLMTKRGVSDVAAMYFVCYFHVHIHVERAWAILTRPYLEFFQVFNVFAFFEISPEIKPELVMPTTIRLSHAF